MCFSLFRQRAISGLWVAWNPLTAPQLTVIKIRGHAGSCLGCRLASVNDGIAISPLNKAKPSPATMINRAAAKIG